MRTTRLSVWTALSALAWHGGSWADDETVISPPFRLEEAEDADWWAVEFAGAARRVFDDTDDRWYTEVIGTWMRDRSDTLDPMGAIKTVRMAFTNDGGTTWWFQDMQSPNESAHEFDPMACFDPVTGSLFAGTMSGGVKDWITRLDVSDHELEDFGELQRVYMGSNLEAHRPSVGVGPKPDAVTESRLYVNLYIPDLLWSDALGVQTSWKGPAVVGDGIQNYCVPRVGPDGQLYLAHRYTPQGQATQIRLDRSVELDDDQDETPLFLSESVIATPAGSPLPTWLPSDLRLSDVVACAVAPHDGDRVFVVWTGKTSEEENDCETTNHNLDLYFAMTSNASEEDPQDVDWTEPMIIPAGAEVSGDQFYPWLEATTYEDGTGTHTRLHLVWYDSRHTPDQCDTGMGSDQTFWFDVYYAYSDDEGETWQEFRLTEHSMNTAYALELGTDYFFGDYIGMAVVGKRAFPFASIGTSILLGPGDPFGFSEAFVWMIVFGDVPSYIDFTVVAGTLTSADDVSLVSSADNQRLVVEDTTGSMSTPLQTIIDIELDTAYTGVDADDEIDIRFEGHAVEAGVTGRIYLKDQSSPQGNWVLWNQFDVNQTGDENSWIRCIPALESNGTTKDYVSSTGRIDVRVEMTRIWTQSGDELNMHVDLLEVVVVDND